MNTRALVRPPTIVAVTIVTAMSSLVACAPDPPAAAAAIAVDNRCRHVTELGAGILIDDGLVLTSAHVVAGANSISIQFDGHDTTAKVVAFDPDNDLAYLDPDVPGDHGWSLATDRQLDAVERGATASVYVARNGALTRLDATIVRRLQINTEDIYIDADVTRPGWEVRYPIKPGDSGGAVVVDGVVIGIVWARSREADDRAYAIDPVSGGDLIRAQLANGTIEGRDGEPIDLERC